jgi:hypothetical protein
MLSLLDKSGGDKGGWINCPKNVSGKFVDRLPRLLLVIQDGVYVDQFVGDLRMVWRWWGYETSLGVY